MKTIHFLTRHRLALLMTLVVGLFLGFEGSVFLQPSAPIRTIPAFAASVDKSVSPVSSHPTVADLESQFSSAVKGALPAVVSVKSSKVVKVQNDFPMDPFFRQFFGDALPQQPPEQRQQGLGSGVIVSPDGYVVTNNHVVDGSQDVRIVLSDKRELKGKIVGSDPRTDLALLKVEATDLPIVRVNSKSTLDVGDIVFAIGNPYGVGQTVTMGIVSATGRGNLGIEDYEDFIQTDAAINPGNSGGALINTNGELVGINTAIIGRSGGNDGIGFAIPSSMVEHVVTQIRNTGKVTRGYLGAYIQEVTPEIASAFNLKDTSGALMSDITPGGPAAKAGLERGDVVVGINGEHVADSRRLRLEIGNLHPGTTVQLNVVRKGQELSVPVKLGELPESDDQPSSEAMSKGDTLRGLAVQELTPEIRRSLGLEAGVRGVVVSDVDSASVAAEAGLRRGDVIQEVNHSAFESPRDLENAFQSSHGKSLLLLVNRGGNTLFVVLPGVTD